MFIAKGFNIAIGQAAMHMFKIKRGTKNEEQETISYETKNTAFQSPHGRD